MKKEIPIEQAYRLINHGPVVLVTSAYKDKTDIITVAWQTPVSKSPMLMAISLGVNSLSLDLIEKSEEFAVNIPPVHLLDKVKFCGTHSGTGTDKFSATGLTPVKAQRVRPPLIEECIGHLECQLYNVIKAGDHKLLIGAVVTARVDEDKYDVFLRVDKEGARTIHHLGGDHFVASGALELLPESQTIT